MVIGFLLVTTFSSCTKDNKPSVTSHIVEDCQDDAGFQFTVFGEESAAQTSDGLLQLFCVSDNTGSGLMHYSQARYDLNGLGISPENSERICLKIKFENFVAGANLFSNSGSELHFQVGRSKIQLAPTSNLFLGNDETLFICFNPTSEKLSATRQNEAGEETDISENFFLEQQEQENDHLYLGVWAGSGGFGFGSIIMEVENFEVYSLLSD